MLILIPVIMRLAQLDQVYTTVRLHPVAGLCQKPDLLCHQPTNKKKSIGALIMLAPPKRCACLLRIGRMGRRSLPKALRGGGSGASERVVFSSPASGRLSPPSNIPETATV